MTEIIDMGVKTSRWYGTCAHCCKWFTHYEIPGWKPNELWLCEECKKEDKNTEWQAFCEAL